MSRGLQVPELVRQRALSNGAAGRRWLDGLPDVVATLAARWGLELGSTFAGGTAALVVAATHSTGRACVLKVHMPLDTDGADTFLRSVLVHDLAGGVGCAELLEHDDDVPAMLLERLGANLHEQAMPVPAVLDTIAATLRTFWRPVPATCQLPTAIDQATWLAASIVRWWDELEQPCPRAVIDRAVDLCAARSTVFDASRAVLVHGDAHGWNTLVAGDGTYKFVDPEGLRSERAHDLAVPMREYNDPLLAGDTARLVRERAESLAAAAGDDIDPEAVWQWGFIERVSTGLLGMREFEGDDGAAFLEVAARCV